MIPPPRILPFVVLLLASLTAHAETQTVTLLTDDGERRGGRLAESRGRGGVRPMPMCLGAIFRCTLTWRAATLRCGFPESAATVPSIC